jgi:uncharacterized membrane protein YecN with MAPEG domain
MPRNTTPLSSFPDAAAILVLFLTCWKVLAWIVGITGVYLLAARFVRWTGVSDKETLEAVAAGLPFALMLLIAFQLKH